MFCTSLLVDVVGADGGGVTEGRIIVVVVAHGRAVFVIAGLILPHDVLAKLEPRRRIVVSLRSRRRFFPLESAGLFLAPSLPFLCTVDVDVVVVVAADSRIASAVM